jgi:hypothetical protein
MSRFVILGVLLAACGNKSSNEGLPPASDWNTDDPAMGMPAPPTGVKPPNPHEGVEGAPDIEDDPHRGVEGAPPLNQEEQAVDEEPQHIDVGSDQPIDPAHRVRGTIKLAKAIADRVKPGGAVFLMAKLPGPDGKPTGSAMAVERESWVSDGQPFELGGATGEVLVIARYDQDEDGITAQPGDVIGMTKVKVPADNVVIELSTVVP